MANRRMFSKTITNSSKFLRMPATSRLLYYDLGMNADDDGYVEWYAIVTMTKASEQDLQVLSANSFITIFDDQVLILLDWKENNLIKTDRYTPSKYLHKYPIENRPIEMEPKEFQVGTKVEPQVRLGKVRLGKVRLIENISTKKFSKLTELTQSTINEVAQQYGVSPSAVEICRQNLELYCQSKGKTYKNYKAALMNFVRSDITAHKIAVVTTKKGERDAQGYLHL